MSGFEVSDPILNSPFEEPAEHWILEPGKPAERAAGRRRAGYYYRDPRVLAAEGEPESRGTWVPLDLVNRIRDQLTKWRAAGYPGVTRTTLELLKWWRRDGRRHRLFFAQLEAAETVVFLTEARADFLQGISVPMDEPSAERKAEGYAAFKRYALKMATGSGKTMVMGMLAAWSILNKVNDRTDARFSDVVLVVCPNVTIRQRLQELNPDRAEASLYRTWDLVPPHLMADLTRGRVVVTNWHVFEPQSVLVGGVSSRVVKAGVPTPMVETIRIGAKTTKARGLRYLTLVEYEALVARGALTVRKEHRDAQGSLEKVEVESLRYVESDTALLNRVLGREVGGKQNILVFNDEAHHAYRIWNERPDEWEEMDEEDREAWSSERTEATVWVDGLDHIHKYRGINVCIDLSATPYFLGGAGQDTNKVFPWTVSDFGLTDAIEAGLVKIPQLVARDPSGNELPNYFNIWKWILDKLTPAERGGKRASPKPEAILKYAHHPIAILGGLWEELRAEWAKSKDDPRPPVFIVVCRNTKIAQLMYEWLGEGKAPTGIAAARIEGFRNRDGQQVTIRVDSKVVQETDTDGAKSDEVRWMRFTLDTVGKTDWPRDSISRPVYPEGFEVIAGKLGRPLHPPGRDVRCIVSVGMLTEGWDCMTVTHIVGLRPFQSQLLCEQVVGRGLRRTSYDVDPATGKLGEEVAKVFGVPFEVIPFKASKGAAPPKPKRFHVHAIPEKAKFEIRFPRLEGYWQAIRNRVTVDWAAVPTLTLDPTKIPPEVEIKHSIHLNLGRPSLYGPGRLENVSLNPYRQGRSIQELAFELARDLTREYLKQPGCQAPPHVLFPQLVRIVQRYLKEKVRPVKPAQLVDVSLSPYYGWVVERLAEAIRPDEGAGEVPEVPRYETSRGDGSTGEVDLWTSKEVREVVHSHLNYVVADTKKWEQSAAYTIDTHKAVEAFAKNAGLGFAIPYVHNGEPHDYVPDFIIRLKGAPDSYLILETKGFDELAEVKEEAARRWVKAVNADGKHGHWQYAIVRKLEDVQPKIDEAVAAVSTEPF